MNNDSYLRLDTLTKRAETIAHEFMQLAWDIEGESCIREGRVREMLQGVNLVSPMHRMADVARLMRAARDHSVDPTPYPCFDNSNVIGVMA